MNLMHGTEAATDAPALQHVERVDRPSVIPAVLDGRCEVVKRRTAVARRKVSPSAALVFEALDPNGPR